MTERYSSPHPEDQEHDAYVKDAEQVALREEEETVEAISALLIADAAAEEAAEAEVRSEFSSQHVREARDHVQKVDALLAQIRIDIQKETLQGTAAEIALRDAERAAQQAHAVLASLEKRMEQDLLAALDAEGKAEVAQGMASSADLRQEDDERSHYRSVERDDWPATRL